ncbi:hypothetical protein DMN91_002341 [Ooceraea biroi]|uniref:Uncharacterized protein n=1 Tax=Ooceraea biroi TaxID=2015173 RepID=A0A026WBX3_OOCBI|nr:uncharacterized protein LOC105281739 [Ooceraea biroi]EZA52559.1 hypothetical protein X777_08041 [Ooceraea biroi]RLU26175.1 hypothetical protein DMN91_002341 [Ooceraea biroi]
MWLSRTSLLLILIALASSERKNEDDASSVFIEEAKNLFSQKSIEKMAQAFAHSDGSKQVGDTMFEKRSTMDGVSQILSGLSNLMSGNQNNQGFDLSMVGSILSALSTNDNVAKRSIKDEEHKEDGIDWNNLINMGSAFFQQNANNDAIMGLVPMVLEALGHGTNDDDAGNMDHSGHSWFLPPILENIHVMWDHFSNSELGQTLWKNSGLSKVIAHMSDEHGNIQWEKILGSFENPTLRRRWINSLTTFVAEWIAHVSDPMNQQRYLTTAQYVGNSFLKSQGFPKTMMFDATRPTESLTRLANAIAKKYLNMKIDSSQYVRPAIAYFQELASLASEKGFIMSRINARELSNKLSYAINNDIIAPILKAYRAYKWSTKVPSCASQILCTINEKNQSDDSNESRIRNGLLRVASFPAAWAVSNKLGINFWSLYGAIMENGGCISKYPAECTAFHEEEIRVTTENIHNDEL